MVGALLEKLTQKKVYRIDGWKNGRHYVVQGQREAWPSITNVLGVIDKPALNRWQIKKVLKYAEDSLLERERQPMTEWEIYRLISDARAAPDTIRDSAADYGTRAHAMLESIIKGEGVDVPSDLEVVLDGYLRWK
jgi:hypothetical protein